MPTHAEQRILPYTPEQLFALVADVERYPEFLPWCVGARIREACRTMPDPPPLAIFDNVYAEPTSILQEEREQYAAYLDSFEEAGR